MNEFDYHYHNVVTYVDRCVCMCVGRHAPMALCIYVRACVRRPVRVALRGGWGCVVPTQGEGRGRTGARGWVWWGVPMGVGMRGRGPPGAVVHMYHR